MDKIFFYPAIFHRAEEGGYWVTFPDMPECFTQGEKMQEAYKMAVEAMGLCLAEKIEAGEELPNASFPDKIEVEEDGVLVMVEFDYLAYKKSISTKAVKKTLSIPEWLNEEALKMNLNFSQILQDALLAKIKGKP